MPSVNLTTSILDADDAAGDLLVELGELDPSAAANDLVEAAAIDTFATSRALVLAANISTEIIGRMIAAAAGNSPGTVATLLVEGARIDAETIGNVLVQAIMTDALATSEAIVRAAKLDTGVIQAALGAGIAGAPGALAALGAVIPVESFVPENPPLEGVDPATGQVWESVSTPTAIEQILAKFPRPEADAHVEVTEFPALPEGVAPLPPGDIADAYIGLSGENFNEDDLITTHVSFFVEKSWLQDNDIHPWSVRFNRYDEERGAWVPFVAKRVREDEDRVTYTATPSGFSLWAISGRSDLPPIQYRVDDLRIDPPQIRERQEVTVEAKVINLGATTIIHNLTLWLNGRVQASKSVIIPPKTTLPVSFVFEPREGAYEVRLDRLVGRLQVGQAPPPPTSSTLLVLGTNSTDRTVTVANPAEGALLEYSVTTDQPWLTANPSRFSLSPGTFQAVTLSVDRTGLPAGNYSGQAVIAFTGLISGLSSITVSMEVSELGVPPVVSPTLNLGPNGTSGTTIVSNPLSGSSLLYTITSHVPWLAIGSTSFVLAPGASQAVVVSVNRQELEVGFHTGLLTIAYSGAISGSSVIAVELEVPPPPPPPLIPPIVSPRLDLGAAGTGGIITVSTPPSGGPLEYAITTDQPWLTATPANFVLSSGESRPITLSVNRDLLDVGRHTAEVTITFIGTTSGSSLIPVTIEKVALPVTTDRGGFDFDFDTWALVLIGFGGAALLWIVVSQAARRQPRVAMGPVRRRAAGVALGTGVRVAARTAGVTYHGLGTALTTLVALAAGTVMVTYQGFRLPLWAAARLTARGAAAAPYRAVAIALAVPVWLVFLAARATWRVVGLLFSILPGRAGSMAGAAAAPYRILVIAVSAPVWLPFLAARAAWRVVGQFFGIMPGRLGSRTGAAAAPYRILVIAVSAPVWLPFLATRAAWRVVGLFFSIIPERLGSRAGATALVYRLSLMIFVAMVVIVLLKAVGVGVGFNLTVTIVIGIGSFGVFFFSLVRGTRSGNIRRAERAAEALDQDRA
ncbi:MAG: PGF-pre-PGF domain-containing protein [Chloroflexi bacterium]|nr:PGF-pre-PGF domain-containing protein [Chloroflexota bacterium]